MANFQSPFAQTGPRRNPTAEERSNGFPCGPADQLLFNGLFHRIEAELGELITFAGLTPTDNEFSQVRQAVQALINAATGGGETDEYLLLSQAVARLPVFPEFLTSDNRINVTSPANGTIRLPGGVSFLHRGISVINTVETDFATVNSKTYHLRWNPVDGFVMKDLADAAYNPGTLAETDPEFDSKYDDMLIARVVTNSSNVPAITALRNANRMSAAYNKGTMEQHPSTWGALPVLSGNQNWGRTPKQFSAPWWTVEATSGFESMVSLITSFDRYSFSAQARGYVLSPASYATPYISGAIRIHMEA